MKTDDYEIDLDDYYRDCGYEGAFDAARCYVAEQAPASSSAAMDRMARKMDSYMRETGENIPRAYLHLF